MASPATLVPPEQHISTTPALSRVAGIDVLRGLSIIAVIVHHITLRIPLRRTAFGQHLPGAIINDLSWNGYNGVIIFFAISGFLITTTCIRRWDSLGRIRVREFYRMRFARIAPMLLALLVVLSALHLLRVPNYTINPQRASLPRALVAALTLHINWLEAHRGYLPANWDVLWSLSNEEAFYLLFPVLCVLARRRVVRVSTLFLFIIAGPFARTLLTHNPLWADYGYLSCMDAIAIGCLAAILCASVSIPRSRRVLLQCSGAALIAFMLLLRAQVGVIGLYKTGLNVTLLALGTALMLIAFTQAMRAGSRVTAPLRWFGRNSYEIYLTHMMVIFALLPLARRFDPDGRWLPVSFLAMIVLSGVLGGAIARFFSEPMNRKLRVRTRQAQAHVA